MLKVRTYLSTSTVHGIGVYADEDIPRGTVIWEFNPHVDLVYTPDEWNNVSASISEPSLAVLKRYSYKEKGNHYLCLDNAQFMNHCATLFNVEDHQEGSLMLARCDIRKGEELLCNYFQFGDSDDEHVLFLQAAGCDDLE
ncbi:MAG: hypothetical protein AMJ60_08485 [Desulfobacterales bacterium SG8_35]|nr:MAG: hypothetical protein AMJ60_08485 [Desulfobacterales bacterium SG8_35]